MGFRNQTKPEIRTDSEARNQDEEGNPIGPSRVWLPNMMLPGLAMSRSIGDDVAACVGVCATPEVSHPSRYKTVKAACKTVKAAYKTVKAAYKTVEAAYKTVEAVRRRLRHPGGCRASLTRWLRLPYKGS